LIWRYLSIFLSISVNFSFVSPNFFSPKFFLFDDYIQLYGESETRRLRVNYTPMVLLVKISVPGPPPMVVPYFTYPCPSSPYSRVPLSDHYIVRTQTIIHIRLRFQLKLGRTWFRARRHETLIVRNSRFCLVRFALIINCLIN